MKPATALRHKIADETTITTGVLCSVHLWPGLVEMVQQAGLDYLIIDLEHMPFNAETVAEACAIGRREDFAVLVRPPSSAGDSVRMALDLGPCGLLVPNVKSSSDMDSLRDAAWMPPRGQRRPGGPAVRWVSDVNAATWRREFEDDLIVFPQIESRVGLENVDAIARHDLTTAIAVGPYDLSAELGVCWEPESEMLQSALQHIRRAGRQAGKGTWMIGDGPALVAAGFRLICLGEITTILQSALRAARLSATVAPAATASTMGRPDIASAMDTI